MLTACEALRLGGADLLKRHRHVARGVTVRTVTSGAPLAGGGVPLLHPTTATTSVAGRTARTRDARMRAGIAGIGIMAGESGTRDLDSAAGAMRSCFATPATGDGARAFLPDLPVFVERGDVELLSNAAATRSDRRRRETSIAGCSCGQLKPLADIDNGEPPRRDRCAVPVATFQRNCRSGIETGGRLCQQRSGGRHDPRRSCSLSAGDRHAREAPTPRRPPPSIVTTPSISGASAALRARDTSPYGAVDQHVESCVPTLRASRAALIVACVCHEARAAAASRHVLGNADRAARSRRRRRPASRRSSRRDRARASSRNASSSSNSASVSPGKPAMNVLRIVISGWSRASARARAVEHVLGRGGTLHELQDARARVLERNVEVGQQAAALTRRRSSARSRRRRAGTDRRSAGAPTRRARARAGRAPARARSSASRTGRPSPEARSGSARRRRRRSCPAR